MIVPGSKKAVLRGPFGNFEVLNGPVLQIFFRTGPKGPEVRWYTIARNSPVQKFLQSHDGFLRAGANSLQPS